MLSANQKKRVLVIDDDNWMQRVLSLFLSNLGYETISRTKAIDGLIEAVNSLPDLILLDYLMPEINGDSIFRMLKNIKFTNNIPVIFISANFSIDVLRKITSSGGTLFLSKPFNQAKLEEKINCALGIMPKTDTINSDSQIYVL